MGWKWQVLQDMVYLSIHQAPICSLGCNGEAEVGVRLTLQRPLLVVIVIAIFVWGTPSCHFDTSNFWDTLHVGHYQGMGRGGRFLGNVPSLLFFFFFSSQGLFLGVPFNPLETVRIIKLGKWLISCNTLYGFSGIYQLGRSLLQEIGQMHLGYCHCSSLDLLCSILGSKP